MPLPRSCSERRLAAHEHDLARDASLLEQLVSASGLGERESLRDEGPDLLLLQERKQGVQVLSKPFRFQPFERLNAVGGYPFAARQKPAAHDVCGEEGGSAEALTTARTARRQPLPA